ncbi:MAG: deoxynucleoside kinase [Cryomorphaceae bacterium]|nr:deoxynucleoside kinase [Cryomorphaceae bacterium]
MLKYRYIAIEGNIGAGKTTLTKMLAEKLEAHQILEAFADNPFLPDFYQNRERFAFPLEMAFMAERYRQLSESTAFNDLFGTPVLADFHPLKSKLFAGRTLGEKEYALYRQFFDTLFKSLPAPDLLIFLDIPVSLAQKNIKIRGRSYEQNIPDEYLAALQEAYHTFIQQASIPVLVIDRREIDFIENPNQVDALIDQLKETIPLGIQKIRAIDS